MKVRTVSKTSGSITDCKHLWKTNVRPRSRRARGSGGAQLLAGRSFAQPKLTLLREGMVRLGEEIGLDDLGNADNRGIGERRGRWNLQALERLEALFSRYRIASERVQIVGREESHSLSKRKPLAGLDLPADLVQCWVV